VAVERIVAAARRRAQDARAEAFAAARAAASRAEEAVLADARREADAIRARAAARLDAAVPSIVAGTLDELYHTGRDPETP
jgi:vacuolar-type H+-ATPase subunit H